MQREIESRPVVALAPIYSASRWTTLHEGIRDIFESRPITNAEAAAVIRAWRNIVGASGPLWYQFAAQAYGWHPPRRDALDTSKKRAAAAYPSQPQLFRWVEGIATELDERNDPREPRLLPDRGTFHDPVFVGDVRAHLLGDGARAPMVTTKKTPAKRRSSSMSPLWLLVAGWLLTSRRRRR